MYDEQADYLFDTEGLVSLANDYKERGVRVVGISSNSVEVKPQDGPTEMAADAKEQGMYAGFQHGKVGGKITMFK